MYNGPILRGHDHDACTKVWGCDACAEGQTMGSCACMYSTIDQIIWGHDASSKKWICAIKMAVNAMYGLRPPLVMYVKLASYKLVNL